MSRYALNFAMPNKQNLLENPAVRLLARFDTRDLLSLYFNYETEIQNFSQAQTYAPDILHEAIKFVLTNRMSRQFRRDDLHNALMNVMEFPYVEKWGVKFSGIQKMIKTAPNANVDYMNAWKDILEQSLQKNQEFRESPSAEPIRPAIRIDDLQPAEAGANPNPSGIAGHIVPVTKIEKPQPAETGAALGPVNPRPAGLGLVHQTAGERGEQLLQNSENENGELVQITRDGVQLTPPHFSDPTETVTVYLDNEPIQIDRKNLAAVKVDSDGRKVWVEWWQGLNHDGSIVDSITKHPVWIHGSLLQYCTQVDHPHEIGEKIYKLPAMVPGKILENGAPVWIGTLHNKDWQEHIFYEYEAKDNFILHVPYLSLFNFTEDPSQYQARRKARVEEMVKESIPQSVAPIYNTRNIADEYEKYLHEIKFVSMPKIVKTFVERQNEIQKKFERERQQWFKKMLWMRFNYPELFKIEKHYKYPTVLFEDMYLRQKKAIQDKPSEEEQIEQFIEEQIANVRKEEKQKQTAEEKQKLRNARYEAKVKKSAGELALRKSLGDDVKLDQLERRKQKGGSERAYTVRRQRLQMDENGWPVVLPNNTLAMEDDPNEGPVTIRQRPEKAKAWHMLCIGQSWRNKKKEDKEQIEKSIRGRLDELFEEYDANRMQSDDEREEKKEDKLYITQEGLYDFSTTPLAHAMQKISTIDNGEPLTQINEEVQKIVASYYWFTDHEKADFQDNADVQLTWKILELTDQLRNEGERRLGQSKVEREEEQREKEMEDEMEEQILAEEDPEVLEFMLEAQEMSNDDDYSDDGEEVLTEGDEKSESDDCENPFDHHEDQPLVLPQPPQRSAKRKRDAEALIKAQI